jgi:glycosyltransferase involved in cell wall biosynthesis
MKIAIIPTINLPMPPVKGGAVQNLTKMFLDQNEFTKEDEVSVFSIMDTKAEALSKSYQCSRYVYIPTSNLCQKIIRKNLRFFSRRFYLLQEKLYIHEICKKLQNNKYDLILLENTPQYAPYIKKYLGEDQRVYTHLHNDWVNLETPNVQRITECTNKFICVSDYIKNRVESVGSHCNAVTVHNGISLEFEECHTLDVSKLRKKYHISTEDIVIIFTGRMVKEKGPHILIEALTKMKNAHKCKVLILGSKLYGETVVDPYLLALKKMIEDNSIKNVVFTGYVPYESIPLYYAMSDIGVLPSLWDDPQPLTIIEYMTFGLPIITTLSGGIPEMVTEECAYIFRRDEQLSNNVAKALDELVENRELRERMSTAGIKRAKEFTEHKFVENLADELRG